MRGRIDLEPQPGCGVRYAHVPQDHPSALRGRAAGGAAGRTAGRHAGGGRRKSRVADRRRAIPPLRRGRHAAGPVVSSRRQRRLGDRLPRQGADCLEGPGRPVAHPRRPRRPQPARATRQRNRASARPSSLCRPGSTASPCGRTVPRPFWSSIRPMPGRPIPRRPPRPRRARRWKSTAWVTCPPCSPRSCRRPCTPWPRRSWPASSTTRSKRTRRRSTSICPTPGSRT